MQFYIKNFNLKKNLKSSGFVPTAQLTIAMFVFYPFVFYQTENIFKIRESCAAFHTTFAIVCHLQIWI